MVAGCGMTCIKYILFVVNFLFFVLGVAAVALGIYAMVDKNNMEALTKIDSDGKLDEFNGIGLLQTGAIVLIVGGAFLLLLGFLGCCGAVKEVKCMLGIYATIVVLIIIIQLAAAGLAIAFRARVEDKLKTGLKNGVRDHYDGNITSDNAFSRAFDFAQVYFECCGVNGTDDFVGSPWFDKKASNVNVPDTCCQQENKDMFLDDNKLNLKDKNCPTKPVGSDNLYTAKPCYNSIRDWIKDRAAIIIGIAFGIVFVEILAVVFACCMIRAIDD